MVGQIISFKTKKNHWIDKIFTDLGPYYIANTGRFWPNNE